MITMDMRQNISKTNCEAGMNVPDDARNDWTGSVTRKCTTAEGNVTGNMAGNNETRFVNGTKMKYGDSVGCMRSPKVKIKRLGKENVRNKDSRNILTGM